MQDLLPDRVIRLLSFHGPVRVVVGSGRNTIGGTAHVAPFEDYLYLFLEPDSRLNLALHQSCAVHVEARHEEGEYVLKIKGRGHCGAVVSRHDRRSELQPWIPENAPHGLLVVPVVPEHIELVQQHDGQTNCYMGQTPAGVARQSSLTRWARASLGGGAFPFALLSMLGPWLWLLGQGATFPRRGLALFSAVMAALSMLAGVRMLVLVWAFECWRRGSARLVDAPVLGEALLPPHPVRLVGLGLVLGAPILLWSIKGAWDWPLAGVVLGCSGVWLMGPAWLAIPQRDDGDTASS